MTTEQGQGSAGDLDDIDSLPCEAKGSDRKAEVDREGNEILLSRDTERRAAKAAYTDARTAAEKVAAEAETVKDATLHDLRCKIDRDVRKAVGRVWRKLRDEINDVSPAPGCRRPPCNADDSVGHDESLASLAGRVAAMRYEAQALNTYLGTLIAEQTALTERVAAVKSDADQLADEVKNAAPDADLIPFYARARVLQWRLSDDELWGGFTVASYLACLNGTMACLRREWRAVAVLEGAIAERACVEAAQLAAAAERRAGALTELLERYRDADGSSIRPTAAVEVDEQGDDEPDDHELELNRD